MASAPDSLSLTALSFLFWLHPWLLGHCCFILVSVCSLSLEADVNPGLLHILMPSSPALALTFHPLSPVSHCREKVNVEGGNLIDLINDLEAGF